MFVLVALLALATVGCGSPAASEPSAPDRVALRGLTVESVPADTGFWAVSRDDRVWVKVNLAGRSPMPVQPGERVDVTGVVVPHGQDFAARESVTAEEDAELLTRLGSHVEVEQADLLVVGMASPGAIRS